MSQLKREIIIVLVTIIATISLCELPTEKSYRIGALEQELNATKEGLIRISEEYNVAMLNVDVPIGTIVKNVQFDCERLTFLNNIPIPIDQLPAEDRSRCKVFENIKLFQDQEGDWFFDKSSGIDWKNK